MEDRKKEKMDSSSRSSKMYNMCIRKEKGINKVQKQETFRTGRPLKSMMLASSFYRRGQYAWRG